MFHTKVKFLQDFSSPHLGNVYIGKISTLDKAVADKFIAAGLAEVFAKPKAVVKDDKSTGNISAGKGASKGNAK